MYFCIVVRGGKPRSSENREISENPVMCSGPIKKHKTKKKTKTKTRSGGL